MVREREPLRPRASESWIGLRDSTAREKASSLGKTGLAALNGEGQ